MPSKEKYKELKEKGICPLCGKRPARPNKVLCQECEDKQKVARKLDRKYYISKGICPVCRVNKLWGEEKICLECKAKKYDSKRNHGYYIKRKEKRLKGHICMECSNPSAPEHQLCYKCMLKRRGQARRNYLKKTQGTIRREERVSYGICYFCGNPVMEGKRTCPECYAKRVKSIANARTYVEDSNF